MAKPKPFTMMIAGKRWRVEWRNMRDMWGQCDCEKRTIRISPQLLDHPDSLRNALRHEIRHAIDDEFAELIAEAHAAALSIADAKLAKYLDAPEDAA